MQMILNSYRGLSLVLDLNLDRIIMPLAIIVGLVGGSLIGTELMNTLHPIPVQQLP